jgi:hypothetical protein
LHLFATSEQGRAIVRMNLRGKNIDLSEDWSTMIHPNSTKDVGRKVILMEIYKVWLTTFNARIQSDLDEALASTHLAPKIQTISLQVSSSIGLSQPW